MASGRIDNSIKYVVCPLVRQYVVKQSNNELSRAWVHNRYRWYVAQYVGILQEAANRGELQPRLPLEEIVRFMTSATDGMHLGVIGGGADVIGLAQQTHTLASFLEFSLNPQPMDQASGCIYFCL